MSKKTNSSKKNKDTPKKDKAQKKEKVFSPFQDSDVSSMLDGIEKDLSLGGSGLNLKEPRQSTGSLAVDIVLTKGLVPGWYTMLGPEQSCKSTFAMSCLIEALASDVPIKAYFDYEGSGESNYIMHQIKTRKLKVDIKEVFGLRNPKTSDWVVKPKVRYAKPQVAEVFFDYLFKLQKALPDKVQIGDDWFYVYENTKKNRAIVGNNYDKKYFSKTNMFRVPAPDGNLQAILILDSYPAMLPGRLDEEDAGAGMAAQARMLSEQLKRVKGRLAAKRICVVGVNQLRKAPMVRYGCYHGSVKVSMADGSFRTIKDLVDNKVTDPVLAFNTSMNCFEPKPITGWFNNGPAKKWLKLKYEVDKNKRGSRSASLVVTPDHEIWSPKYKTLRKAKDFMVGDTLTTMSKYSLSEHGRQLFLGMMLGDGWLYVSEDDPNYVKLCYFHKSEHSWLLEWKNSIINMGSVCENGTRETPFIYAPDLAKFALERKKGCEGHDKRISKKFAKSLDILGLAVWFMDDGSKSNSKTLLKMQSYPVKDVRMLCRVINTKFNTGCTLLFWNDKNAKNGRGYGIKFDQKLMDLIAPYVHENFIQVCKDAFRKNCIASGTVREDTIKGKLPKHLKRFGTFKGWVPGHEKVGVPVKITQIEELSKVNLSRATNLKGNIVKVKSPNRYEIEVEGLGMFLADGIVAKNSPDYEPCGEAIRFFCFSADTLVQTEAGLLYPHEVMDEQKLPKVLGEKGLEAPTIFKEMGISPIAEAHTSYGYTVKGKPNHRVRAVREGTVDIEWKKLKNLRLNGEGRYFVPVKLKGGVFNSEIQVIDYKSIENKHANNHLVKLDESLEVGEDFAEILGYLIAEGYVRNGRIIFTNKDEALRKRYRKLFSRVFGVLPTRKHISEDIFSTQICEMLVSIGAGGQLARFKEIPRCIRKSPADVQLAFLKALFQGDGYFDKKLQECYYMSTSNQLLDQLQLMLLNFGIFSKKIPYTVKYTDHHLELASEINRTKMEEVLSMSSMERYGSLYNLGKLYISGYDKRLLESLLFKDNKVAEKAGHGTVTNVLPDLLGWRNGLGTKLKSWIENLRGNRKFFRIDDFYPGWKRDAKEWALTLRTGQERKTTLEGIDKLGTFISYTKKNNIRWVPVVDVKITKEQMTYDFCMPDTHTVVTNGIVSHNSDARVKATPRALSGAPYRPQGKGSIEKEDSVTVKEGTDKYRYVHALGIKNKLGMPYIEGWIRLWISDGNKEPRGFDPVFDTFFYLNQTGQVTHKCRKQIVVKLRGENVKEKHKCKGKSIDWMTFKTMILGDTKAKEKAMKQAGFKESFDLRNFCKKQLSTGDGILLFTETQGATEAGEAGASGSDQSDNSEE